MQVVNLSLSLPIANCRLPIANFNQLTMPASFFQIGNWQSAIGNNQ